MGGKIKGGEEDKMIVISTHEGNFKRENESKIETRNHK